MAVDADDATSALIAAMLAEDNPYNFAENVATESSSSSTSDRLRGGQSRASSRSSGSSLQASADTSAPSSDDDDDSAVRGSRKKQQRASQQAAAAARLQKQLKAAQRKTAKIERQQARQAQAAHRASLKAAQKRAGGVSRSGRKRRKDFGVAGQKREVRRWTVEEKQCFEQAFAAHGRQWDKVKEAMRTDRDVRSIKSHAQKYLVHLWRDRKELPDKVKESGEGYTLSGRPLNPLGGSAQAYGGARAKQAKADAGVVGQAASAASAASAVSAEPKKRPLEPPPTAPAPAPAKKPRLATKKLPPLRKHKVSASAPERKSRRVARRRLENPEPFVTPDADPLELVPCRHYKRKASSSVQDLATQPFHVSVSVEALLLADLHAHMAHTEIIGFLAGQYDADRGHVVVTRAFPCRSVKSGTDTRNVEMDPASEVALRAEIEAQGDLRVVGWYHSHPEFEPDPSLRDLDNQRNYQTFFRDERTREEPFIGLIVGSYDVRMPTPLSIITAFHVRHAVGRSASGMDLDFQVMDLELKEGAEPVVVQQLPGISPAVTRQAVETIQFYAAFNKRVSMRGEWRPFAMLADALKGVSSSSPVSRLDKMLMSLEGRMLDHVAPAGAKAFVDEVRAAVAAHWTEPDEEEDDDDDGDVVMAE